MFGGRVANICYLTHHGSFCKKSLRTFNGLAGYCRFVAIGVALTNGKVLHDDLV